MNMDALDRLMYDIHLDKKSDFVTILQMRTYLGLPSWETFFTQFNDPNLCQQLYGMSAQELDHLIPPFFLTEQEQEILNLPRKIRNLSLGEHVEYFEKDGLLL